MLKSKVWTAALVILLLGAQATWVTAGSGIDLGGYPNPARLMADGGAAQDRAGATLAAADLNGDGIADLVVAAPMADPGGRVNAGEVYVIYGSAQLGGNVFFDASFAGPRLRGGAALDQFGSALAVGDFNGDGVDDLAVGAWFAGPAGRTDAGAAYLFFGQVGAFPSVDLASQAAPITVLGAAAGDEAGSALALSDLDGDGLAELVVGAPLADPAGRADAGTVYVVRGRANFTGTVDLATYAQKVVIQGAAARDGLGAALAAGNTDGDGRADLLIGAPYASPAGRTGAGKAYVVKGRSPLINLDLAAAAADLTVLGAAANDNLGASASMGDLDGSGSTDLVLGAPTAGRHGFASSGVAYGILWRDPPPATVDLGTETAALTVEGGASYDRLGIWIKAADLDRDGKADLLVGAPEADPFGRGQAGTVFAFSGVLGTGQVLPAASADLAIYGAGDGDRAGAGFAVADATADASGDLIVGAPRADSVLGVDAGRVYLLPGPFLLRPTSYYLPLIFRRFP